MLSLAPWTLVAVVALVALASGLPEAHAQEDGAGETTDLLFLEAWPDMFTPGNFTSRAPADDPLPQRPHPIDQETQRIHWDWWLDRLPAPWRIEKGADVRVHLYLANLDQLLPSADPLSHPDSVGSAKLIARIDHLGQYDPAATASVEIPFGTDVAAGEIVEVVVEMEAASTLFYPMEPPPAAEHPLFGLNVTLVAVASNRLEPAVLVDTDHPSSVSVEGFPMAAYRAWEDAEGAVEACHDAILRGEPCLDPPDDTPIPYATPAPGALLSALLLCALLMPFRRR